MANDQNRDEYSNQLERHLARSFFGGNFGEGWRGLKAPRVVFYSYMITMATMWLVVPLLFVVLLPVSPYIVIVPSIAMIILFVILQLTIIRGPMTAKFWVSVLIEITLPMQFVEFIIYWAISETYRAVKEQQ